MPKMSDQAKKGSAPGVYQKARKKREQEVSAVQEDLPQDQMDKTSSETSDSAVRQVGRPHSDKTAKMSIVMKPELRTRLKTYCAMHNTTAADVIDMLVRDMLEKSDLPDLPADPPV